MRATALLALLWLAACDRPAEVAPSTDQAAMAAAEQKAIADTDAARAAEGTNR